MSRHTTVHSYVRHPESVEAIQWDGSPKSTEAIKKFVGVKALDTFTVVVQTRYDGSLNPQEERTLEYNTQEGRGFRMYVGSWIFRGPSGRGEGSILRVEADKYFRKDYVVEDAS